MLIPQDKNWGGNLQSSAEQVKWSCYLLNFNTQTHDLQWPQSQHCFGSAALEWDSWAAELTDEVNSGTKKFTSLGSIAVVQHRDSCDSLEMSLLLLPLGHPQAPVNGTAFLSHLGSAELPSTGVKDFSIHHAKISAVQSHWDLWGDRVYLTAQWSSYAHASCGEKLWK